MAFGFLSSRDREVTPPVWAAFLGPGYRYILAAAVICASPTLFLPFFIIPDATLANLVAIWDYSLLFESVGLLLGFKGHLRAVAVQVVNLLRWDMEIPSHWHKCKGQRVLIFHTRDGVIPYKEGSLHQIVAPRATPLDTTTGHEERQSELEHKTSEHSSSSEIENCQLNKRSIERGEERADLCELDTIELTKGSGQYAHMCHLSDTAQWANIVHTLRRALRQEPLPLDAPVLSFGRQKDMHEMSDTLRRAFEEEDEQPAAEGWG
eukprot:gb/GEZN01009370.1/.p1 GENE.gb/GEZN01009370.1/~~gb/GEZN01009370.1/.p1  ORF type:complete len:310 (-),score=27.46 gb/GEZN01009370.1/:403-1194(-)